MPYRLHPRLDGSVYICCLVASLAGSGCSGRTTPLNEKASLPVRVTTLTKSVPESSFSASGSVKSWKTEDIGFEVSGRVQWVLEPGKDIDGRVVDPDGKLVRQGTPLAQVEPARYEIAVESAEASLEVAKLSKEGIEIQIQDSLPAELKSAESNLKLAEIEFSRMEKLNRQNAASKSEYDQAKNLVQTRLATISGLLASDKQARAELKSAESQIKRAEQALRDAKRDLANTTLYGSYQGQISQVQVVPGSVVSAGSPVLTLQMTNPIKIEVELSAEQSRAVRRRRNLPTTYTLPDGSLRRTSGFVYNVDASADPATRTFTMTMLLLNEKVRDQLSSSIPLDTVARAEDIWPLRLNRMMGTPDDVILVEEKSILRDDVGPYIYMVTNAKIRDMFPELIKVKRQRLVENELRIPFLGNWVFRSVTFLRNDGEAKDINPDSLYVGQLVDAAGVGTLDGGEGPPKDWDGESVALDTGSEWMLRPGELVTVDLSDNHESLGFYVPIEAISEESGETSIFTVENGKAKKVPVTLVPRDNLDTGSQVEVQSPQLSEGMGIVSGGVHFLRDGAAVRVIGDPSPVAPKTLIDTEAL